MSSKPRDEYDGPFCPGCGCAVEHWFYVGKPHGRTGGPPKPFVHKPREKSKRKPADTCMDCAVKAARKLTQDEREKMLQRVRDKKVQVEATSSIDQARPPQTPKARAEVAAMCECFEVLKKAKHLDDTLITADFVRIGNALFFVKVALDKAMKSVSAITNRNCEEG